MTVPADQSKRRFARHGLTSLAALLLAGGIAPAQTPGPSLGDGLFSRPQADRGAEIYQSNCASCHGADLTPSDSQATRLTGLSFKLGWMRRTLAERLETIRASMPPGRAGKLTDQQYLDVIAFLLSANGYPSGVGELTPDPERLKVIIVQPLAAPAGTGKPAA